MIRIYNYILSILAYSCIVFSQVTLSISDYYPFPSELSDLNVNPDVLEWGVAGSFLLLDQKENQLVSIGSLNGFQTVGGFGLCLLYTSPSPRDRSLSRMPSSA